MAEIFIPAVAAAVGPSGHGRVVGWGEAKPAAEAVLQSQGSLPPGWEGVVEMIICAQVRHSFVMPCVSLSSIRVQAAGARRVARSLARGDPHFRRTSIVFGGAFTRTKSGMVVLM